MVKCEIEAKITVTDETDKVAADGALRLALKPEEHLHVNN